MGTVLDYWSAGGPLMWPIAGLALLIWFWTVVLYRRVRSAPDRALSYVRAAGGARGEARLRAAEARSAEVAPLRRELAALRAMVAAVPLLGLLGTVTGMVATFSALGARGAVSTVEVSGGISQALVTTQVGLVVALPGLFASHAIARRLEEFGLSLDHAARAPAAEGGGS